MPDKKPTLGEVLAYLTEKGEAIGKDKPMVDLKGIVPMGDHHRTAVFIRLPYPDAIKDQEVIERLTKLLTSLNRPDTIKVDVYTMLGGNIMKGWNPYVKDVGGVPFNQDWVHESMHGSYVLQVTVDIVKTEVLEKALNQ